MRKGKAGVGKERRDGKEGDKSPAWSSQYLGSTDNAGKTHDFTLHNRKHTERTIPRRVQKWNIETRNLKREDAALFKFLVLQVPLLHTTCYFPNFLFYLLVV